MEKGVLKAEGGMNGLAWNVVGHTYVPKLLTEDAFVWHATIPDGTFVPPHIHPTQDEWIYMIDGELDVEFPDEHAKAGDDFAARVYVIRDGGLLKWRTRAINYVWAGSSDEGQHWPNPFNRFAKL